MWSFILFLWLLTYDVILSCDQKRLIQYSIWCIVCTKANICFMTALQLVDSHHWSSGFWRAEQSYNNSFSKWPEEEMVFCRFNSNDGVNVWKYGVLLTSPFCFKPNSKDVNGHSPLHNVSQTFIFNALLITTVLLCCMLSVNHPLTAIIDSL